MSSPDVAVIGGGLIGSAIAWRLTQAGAQVVVYDRADSGQASTVAAGMLASATEAHFGETELLRLSTESARDWPGFAAELAEVGGDVGYRTGGTLLVGVDTADQAEIDRYREFYRRHDLNQRRLDAAECHRLEPLLSHRVSAGLLATDDHQVDPRRVLAALTTALDLLGVRRIHAEVADVTEVVADRVVVAAGSWSGRLIGLPVRPVQGQVLRLRSPRRHLGGGDGQPGRSIRALNRGRSVYLVPRTDGEVVVGATSREVGFDTAATAGDTFGLLRDAIDVVPELAEYHLAETNVGLRPGTPDNAPLLGPVGDGRVVAATGHYRNGVLLAPITAELITGFIGSGSTPARMKPFSPARFAA